MARKHHLGLSEEEWSIRSLQPISAVTEAKANLKKTWGLPRNRNSASGFSGGFAFQELAVVLLREREREEIAASSLRKLKPQKLLTLGSSKQRYDTKNISNYWLKECDMQGCYLW